jgi:hypothetical protein
MGQVAPDTAQQVKDSLPVSLSLPTRAQEPPATHVLLLDVRDEDAFRSCRSTAALSSLAQHPSIAFPRLFLLPLAIDRVI